MELKNNVYYIGVNDEKIDLFEGQYKVPNGMSYNSYLIKDEKNVVLDTIDKSVSDIWLKKLEKELDGEEVDYLIVSHLEPDHSYNIGLLAEKYPNMKIVGNAMTFNILPKFFENIDLEKRKVLVKEGDTLQIGNHSFKFFMAPMVHWPEVMFIYEETEKILFTADAFGKFGANKEGEKWLDEARRFYIGIVGKYGPQVQAILKKVQDLNIKMICPLHGYVLKDNLRFYLEKYFKWSNYEPEQEGILIACSSIHGNTLEAGKYLEGYLKKQKKNVHFIDLTREDMSQAVAKAFQYSKLIVMSSSYNAGVFPAMERFLNNLKSRNYQKRKVAIVENGSWAPSAGKTMKSILQEMKDIDIIEPIITIESTMKEKTRNELEQLAENI
ncbi:MAG: FprA family A-type flavoprotein [Clostridia bacterium]|nr:FprA family A-type flavoprotein [Clostridia bacterium]